MRGRVQTIGVVLETRDDALRAGAPLEHLYHWREPEEIEAITKSVRDLGFDVVLLGDPETLCRSSRNGVAAIDFILNLSVGFRSRFRLALGPALYELLGIPYSGADPFSKIVSQNKHILKSFLDRLNISTPPWTYVRTEDDITKASFPDFPLIVKPAHEGSSIGIGPDSLVCGEAALRGEVRRIFRELNMPVIVEKFIGGREYKAGMIGDQPPAFFGLMEDTLADGSPLGSAYLFFDAKKAGKYGKTYRDISLPRFSPLHDDCMNIWRHFSPVDYCTFDIRVDEQGNHYVLEFNADATLHPQRTLARCCELSGLAYGEMIALILRSSFRRWGLPWR